MFSPRRNLNALVMTAWETARKLFFIPNPSRLWSLVSCLRLRAISGSNRKVAWFGNALLGTQGGHLTSDATGEQPGRPEIRVLRSNAPFIHITRTQKRPSPYADPARWSRNRFSRPLFTESLPPFLIPPRYFRGAPTLALDLEMHVDHNNAEQALIPLLAATVLKVRQDFRITPSWRYVKATFQPHLVTAAPRPVKRATQSGIEADAQAFLMHVSERFSPCQIVLWGHSLGAAVAASALLERLSQNATHAREEDRAPIRGLIMEAPISNIKDMLISLYPQKWLPYRYLWPFSWNSWCNYTNLERLAALRSQKVDQSRGVPQTADCRVPPILILSPENDEVIPPTVAEQLEHQGKSLGLDVRRQNIRGAMHTEVPTKPEGKKALVEFIIRTTHDPPRG
ncbi:hypothetical protein N7470_007301 [Penicillium chermesinum]|nr:hypothetical protein N7470_007301 [Penicillium chermesinum]